MNALLITWPVTEKESMPLTDTNAVINIGRSQAVANQGLIDAKCGVSPKENRYAYIICKVYRTYEDGNKEWPVQYLLALNIRINGKIHFIDSSFGSNEELGDIRKNVLRIMSCGRLQRVKFRYTGPDVDAAPDRLPTAEITDEDEDGYIISAEVFGKGIDLWFRSQGDYIKVIEGGDGR